MFPFRMLFPITLAVVLLGRVACAAEPAIIVVQPFLAGMLDPAVSTEAWALQSHGIAETLFTVAPDGTVVPQIAESAEAADDGSWTVRLHPDCRFPDGTPVDATAACFAARRHRPQPARGVADRQDRDRRSQSTYVPNRTARPVPAMRSVLAEYFHVVHKWKGDRIVFTGPYRVTQFCKDDRVELEPNPFSPQPGWCVPVVVRKLVDAQARALALESGDADLAFQLPPESLDQLRGRGIRIDSTLVGYQDLLSVRRAIDLAISRALVAALRGGEIATGFYPTFYHFAAKQPRPYDPERAARLLDEAGWKRGPDGVRAKSSDRLAFTLLSVTQAAEYGYMALLIKDDLAKIGIDVKGVERSLPFLMAGDFDIGFNFSHAAPGTVLPQYRTAQCRPEAGVIVGDDKLDAVQTACLQPQQEIPPARSALAVGELHRQHPGLPRAGSGAGRPNRCRSRSARPG
jgi:ABC-type transport system substrate-binding protein